ncbi:hypothetical protein NL676_017257 [Syzygium grande]|nr:hypothetical protein NL676_017257 [Syzygium grande]
MRLYTACNVCPPCLATFWPSSVALVKSFTTGSFSSSASVKCLEHGVVFQAAFHPYSKFFNICDGVNYGPNSQIISILHPTSEG